MTADVPFRNNDWFTTGQVAVLCRISQQTVIRAIDSGKLKGWKVPGSKFRRVTRANLLRFMRETGTPTDLINPTTEVTTHDAGTGETQGGAGSPGPSLGEQKADGGRAGGESEDALQPAEPLGD